MSLIRRQPALAALAVLTVIGLALGGCGGSGDGDDTADGDGAPSTTTTTGPESDYAEELVGAIAANQDNLGLSDGQTFCIANGVVDALGGQDALEDAGVTPEALRTATSPADLGVPIGAKQLAEAADIFPACQVDLVGVFMDGIAVDFTIGASAEDCFRQQLSQQTLADLAATQLMTGVSEEVPDSLVTAALPCLELLQDPEVAPE